MSLRRRRRIKQTAQAIAKQPVTPVKKARPHIPLKPAFWYGSQERLISGDITHCIKELNRIYDLEIDPDYHRNDHILGRQAGKKLPGFPAGSIFQEEGQLLYSLIHGLKPASILEVGTWYGCSATHMAAALEDMQSETVIYAVDNAFDGIQLGWDSGDCKTVGSMIPERYRKYVDIHLANMEDEIPKIPDESINFIFEDSLHTYFTTYFMALQLQRVLKPGGFFVTHDIMFANMGSFSDQTVAEDMVRAFRDAGIFDEFYAVLVTPSDTGVGIWRKPQQ